MPWNQYGRLSPTSNAYISEQIRNEIQRFESVHPCIYTVYDLIELIPDQLLQSQLRDQVVCIEDAFVNSQEWTLSRGVVEFKLGLVGSLRSGKTSLVHRYLTGAYTNEESPEGGRFKKEVVLDGQSYLLLIRDEGNAVPDYQFAQWIDAIIFVFSVESRESIETALQYYDLMTKYRNVSEVPVLLVGTQDAISESNPRVISEQDGRQMAKSLPKSASYYEACSTYGLNVERIFKDACQKMIHQRLRLLGSISNSGKTPVPPTPSNAQCSDLRSNNHEDAAGYANWCSSKGVYHHQRSLSALPLQDGNIKHIDATNVHPSAHDPLNHHREISNIAAGVRGVDDRPLCSFAIPSTPASTSHPSKMQRASQRDYVVASTHTDGGSCANLAGEAQNINHRNSTVQHPSQIDQTVSYELFDNRTPGRPPSLPTTSTSHNLLTPSSTPTTQRRNRRISNLFRPKDSHHSHDDKSHRSTVDVNMGMGRAIPVKQGHLYKRSSKTLNKEWKKKYVCLHPDGRLSYHQTLKDYMERDTSGKEVYLGLATVRVAGRQGPRVTHRQTQSIVDYNNKDDNKRGSIDALMLKRAINAASTNGSGQEIRVLNDEQCTPVEGTSGGSDDQQQNNLQAAGTSSSVLTSTNTPMSGGVKKKKGHRRLGSAAKNEEDDDCEFEVVTCDQKRWEFSATSAEERDEWVSAIEELIEKSLQAQLSQKQPANGRVHGNKAEVQALRYLPGNDKCADCGALRPDWASLNLGTLICIECSGIHRNLGSHISKVRSLDLDDWPVEYINVLESIGNTKANAVWEHSASPDEKPYADSPRGEKEKWIKIKYESKRYLAPLVSGQSLGRQLLDAVFNNDLSALLPILPRCGPTDLRTTVDSNDRRTALHIACSNASAACTQLLVWYSADMRLLDEMGRSALWHAETSGALDCASILINAGLEPNYGKPSGPEVPNMITGSLSSREYYAAGDHPTDSDARLRRQSDVVVRRISPNKKMLATPNGFHQRASDAFERLPASVI